MEKLVRDKIPDIIKANGDTAEFTRVQIRTASYRDALITKLREETDEFEETPLIEELADILEVVYALVDDIGFSALSLEKVRAGKEIARGGFYSGIILK